MKTKYWVCIYILAMFFHLIIGWRLPLYAYMMCIDLPDDAIVIKRVVSLSDVCYWHIMAETAFVSEQGYDNIRDDINETNRFLMETIDLGDWILRTPAAIGESEHTGISWYEMDRLDEKTERLGYQHWYCISLQILGLKRLRAYSCFSIIVSLAVTTAVCIVLDKRMKKGKQKT